ncbi:serine/threonine-protein kinase [Oerskovia paurometabola]|uniref:serine/threonine-protein kinase n=1 Tax=Oerskovia paurometabola TaxID=162170 RepID=UPI00381B445C
MRPVEGLALGDRYRLVRRIAIGGMGEVWVANDRALGREVAVKLLREEYAGNEDFLERLRTEARNSAALSHPNIAQMYDYGEQNQSGYLVMELVMGEPMADLLEREPVLMPSKLLPILAQTARALHAAHVAGVVHRDVKPGNILLEPRGIVKITDFGVSLAANQVPMTATGMVMGTAQYLSPEQAIGQAATGASDVYALGIVAYESVAGNRPFTGSTPVDIAVAHVNEKVPPLPAHVHPSLASLIYAMLAKDPKARPMPASALAQTLDDLVETIARDPWGATARAGGPSRRSRRSRRAQPARHGASPPPSSPTPLEIPEELRSRPLPTISSPRLQDPARSAHSAPSASAASAAQAGLSAQTGYSAQSGYSGHSALSAPSAASAAAAPAAPATASSTPVFDGQAFPPPPPPPPAPPVPGPAEPTALPWERASAPGASAPAAADPPADTPRSYPPRREMHGGASAARPRRAESGPTTSRTSAQAGSPRAATAGVTRAERRRASQDAPPVRTSTTTGQRIGGFAKGFSWPLLALLGLLLVVLVATLVGGGDERSEGASSAPNVTRSLHSSPDLASDDGMMLSTVPGPSGSPAPTTSKDS